MTRRLLFAHDDRVVLKDGRIPISFNYTRHLIDRYRYLADHITFAVRCKTREPVRWYHDATIIGIPEVKHGLSVTRYPFVRQFVQQIVSEHDIVVARLPSLIGSWALDAALRNRIPVITEFVGCPWDALWNHSLKGKMVAPYFWLKNRRMMQRAKYTVYVTENFLQQRYPTPGVSIACSNVELAATSTDVLQNRLKRISTLQNDDYNDTIILGTIANLDVPYKGHHLVMRALASLVESRPRFIYRMIGPGDSSRLRKLAEQMGISHLIDFAGACERVRIPVELDRIDLYLQPSLQEGLPRAAIEAMSRGCPVIGANTGGIPELLDPKWVVPRNDWRQIASMLKRISKLDLGAAAVQNFGKAQAFQIEELNRRRCEFYDKFLLEHNMGPCT